jgi:hypothetical protein
VPLDLDPDDLDDLAEFTSARGTTEPTALRVF